MGSEMGAAVVPPADEAEISGHSPAGVTASTASPPVLTSEPSLESLQSVDSLSSDCYLLGATVLGGYLEPGYGQLQVGDVLTLRFTENEVRIRFDNRPTPLVMAFPFQDLLDIEIGGPGVVETGGGFIGGGFGIKGSLEGMAFAHVLNRLTTRKTINTMVRLDTSHGEIFLHTSSVEPGALRIVLSGPIWKLAHRA